MALDFPVFHTDFFGNRMLIAFIAIGHVVVNHALAVGAMPLVTVLEWRAYRRRDEAWDRLAYRILFVCFIITTSVGALTGVGIWFSAALVNPAAIGSLIRVFFMAWLTEWVVFVVEVCLIVAYFLTWHKWGKKHKRLHIGLGAVLSISSWLTMAIIVAILGFMMHSGQWTEDRSFFSAVLNPVYLPQLVFRTPLALAAAGLFVLFLIPFLTKRDDPIRPAAIRWVATWTLAWVPLCWAGGWWYWSVIPDWMQQLHPVALTTMEFGTWYRQVVIFLGASVATIVAVLAWGICFPRWLPRFALVVPFLLVVGLLGYYERAREFIRKPYVIHEYMYANGIRVADYPLLKEQGILKQATYVAHREVTETNKLVCGEDVFRLSCTRCHTTRGVNGAMQKFENLYGHGPWEPEDVKLTIRTMHVSRPYMPPFPGNEAELDALAHYLCSLQKYPASSQRDQVHRVRLPSG
jgi:mono/diheme cytochrome c family protein